MVQVDKKTTFKKREKHIHTWFTLDASGKTLGRFASEVSKILRGKHRPDFTPFADCGDGVIIINAEKIHVSGAKPATKIYKYSTGHMSGLREVPFNQMIVKNPQYVLESAVWGMMPKSRLSKQQMRRLRVFRGDKHPHIAQKSINVSM
jgi:large subunit ribosomal protein L13